MSYRAQWFDPIGSCCRCRKKASGTLMSFRNEKMGAYCERCANIEIKDGQQQRAKERKLDEGCGDCGKRGHSACNGISGAIADLNSDELDGESEK